MESTPIHDLETVEPRGFTLVEMIVVLAIIVIITMIAILGQSTFNRSLVLTETAYTIAFSVRQAQFLGISSREFREVSNAGHGVSFSTGDLRSYKLFADINPTTPNNIQSVSVCPGHTVNSGPEARPGDCRLNDEAEVVTTYNLNNGFRIAKFCGIEDNGNATCSTDNNGIDGLHITYLRPNTQSVVVGTRSSARFGYASARIHVVSPDGEAERCVAISKAGHVSVLQKGETGCP